MESWKRIKDYPNYEISDQGRVRNIKTGLFLKYNPERRGYLRVRLYKNSIAKPIMVHRLVAQYFIPNKCNKPEVNHKNGIKTDNNVTNLEWVTKSENMKHAVATGLKKGFALKGADSPLSKKVAMINKNGEVVRVFPCVKEVERELGFFCSNIVNVCNGKNKTSHGYVWAYL